MGLIRDTCVWCWRSIQFKSQPIFSLRASAEKKSSSSELWWCFVFVFFPSYLLCTIRSLFSGSDCKIVAFMLISYDVIQYLPSDNCAVVWDWDGTPPGHGIMLDTVSWFLLSWLTWVDNFNLINWEKNNNFPYGLKDLSQ